jgi:hypothetical protein
MKKDNSELEDEMRSEYDLRSLMVRKFSVARKSFDGGCAAITRCGEDVS